MNLACIDGVVMPAKAATVPATDLGLLRGDGVFEVIRLYAGRPFAFEEHLARLGRSGANLRLPVDVERLRADAEALLAQTGEFDGLLRMVVTRGGRRIALVEPLPELPETLRLATVMYSPSRVLDGVKSLSYAANMHATRLAQERGFDEALLVTPHGRVLEGPTSSFFWVEDDVLKTPPLSEHVLASITRSLIGEVMEVVEEACAVDDLGRAREAFLVSTVREVMPVSAIEDLRMDAPGAVTAEADRRLRARIAAEPAARPSL
jgi:branched-chain amino acid aminotransferase